MMFKKLIVTLLSLSFLLSGCQSFPDAIRINGDLEETIEVFSEYVDKGVTYPKDKYDIIVSGLVDSKTLGRYELIYSVYSKDWELKKELHRFVNVVDTKAPTAKEITEKAYFVGIEYQASDFFDYQDNYYAQKDIDVTPKAFVFTREKEQEVSFTIKDKSNNEISVSRSIKPVFDLREVALHVHAQVSSGGNETTGPTVMVDIQFSDGIRQSLTYFIETKSLHYIYNKSSSIGYSASVQISAKFGEFSNADLTYHVDQSAVYNNYKAGFATIDATKTTGQVKSFKSTTGSYDVSDEAMIKELNERLPIALSNFHQYMEETLHIDIY